MQDDTTNNNPTDDKAGQNDSQAKIEPAYGIGSSPVAQQKPDPMFAEAKNSDSPSLGSNPSPSSDNSDTPNPSPSSASSSDDDDDLASIKREALTKLAPIVGGLDQEPEERYRTLMMLIQASDNQKLLREAYEAADKIDDEKLRAEALLNVINEINYFTSKNQKAGDS